MKIDVIFSEKDCKFTPEFGESIQIGSFENGYDAGKQAEYDRFWDAIQTNGTRVEYTYAFARWADHTVFHPKYDIRPLVFNQAFYNFNTNNPHWEDFDMVAVLEKCGVVLDTSGATGLTTCFSSAWIGRIGVIDCTGTTNHVLSGTFGYGKIKTIDKLIVKPEHVFTNTFINNTELTNITFEGTIGNDISFQWQNKLTNASVQSIIDHLQDLNGQTAKKVQFHTDVLNRLTDEQFAVIAAKNWTM